MTELGTFSDPYHGGMSLIVARSLLRERADTPNGDKCPCCTQKVKVYNRNLTAVAARFVIALFEECGREWGNRPDVARKRMPEVSHQGGQLTLGQHWDLIEEDTRKRADGGRQGWWRVTALGELWIRGEETVPKYARIYDSRRLGLHGDLVTVRDVLGEGFDYGHLMRRTTTQEERAQDLPLFGDPAHEAAA